MIVGVFTAIGVMFGLIEVGIVALARESRQPGLAGVMLALWALGSLISGLAYGTRRWQTSPVRRLQIGVSAMTVGCTLIAAVGHSLAMVTAALVVAGLANAPTQPPLMGRVGRHRNAGIAGSGQRPIGAFADGHVGSGWVVRDGAAEEDGRRSARRRAGVGPAAGISGSPVGSHGAVGDGFEPAVGKPGGRGRRGLSCPRVV